VSTSVTITGTGCPIPDGNRAGPGALVRYDDGQTMRTMQFDAGRSTVQRLAGADVWIPVAPSGPAADYVATLLDGWDDDIDVRASHAGRNTRPRLDLRVFDIPKRPTEVWRDGDVVVSAGQVRHEPCPNSVGYRISTPDGSVAITGDTKVCDEVAELAEGVDVLVYEAMRFSFFESLPPRRRYVTEYHADTKLIGSQAAELGVPKLVLTHLIPAPVTAVDRQAFVDEVRAGGYEGELVVADDLYTCEVGTGGMPKVREIGQPAAEQT